MVDREMLSAISELLDEKLEQKLDQKFDEKFQPVYERLDGLESDVGGLKEDVGSLKEDVGGLKDEMRYVRVVLLENNIIPRLNTIEECYLDTFQRYKERTEQFDQMSEDIEALKSVVSEHSKNWKKYRVIRTK